MKFFCLISLCLCFCLPAAQAQSEMEDEQAAGLIKKAARQLRSDMYASEIMLETARQTAEDTGDKILVAKVTYLRAEIARRRGWYQKCRVLCRIGREQLPADSGSLWAAFYALEAAALRDTGQDSLALIHFREAKKMYRQAGDQSGEIKVLSELIASFIQNKLPDSADFAGRKVREYLIKNKNEELKFTLLLNTGKVLENREMYDSAAYFYDQSLRTAEKIPDENKKINSILHAARLHNKRKAYRQAIKKCSRGIDLSHDYISRKYLSKLHAERASAYENTGLSEEARLDRNSAGGYRKRNNNMGYQTILWRIQENTEIDKEEFEKIAKAYESNLKTKTDLNTETGSLFIVSSLGRFYFREKRYEESVRKYKEMLRLSRKLHRIHVERTALEALAEVYSLARQYDTARKYRENYRLNAYKYYVSDSKAQKRLIFNKRSAKENAVLKAEIVRKNFLFYGSAIGIVLVIIILGLVQRSRIQQQKANSLLSEQAEELKTANEKLVELDTFKETVTGMIVHDLKNPLNVIMGSSEDILEPANAVSRLHTVNRSAKKMLNLVLNILDVRRFEEARIVSEPVDFSLHATAEKAIRELDLFVRQKQLQVHNNIPTSLFAFADPELTERIFVNLLSNAVKYSPQNTAITFRAAETENKLIEIALEDEGQGIPAGFLEHIFDKFFRADNKNNSFYSTGLGLAFCRMAVKVQGGEIRADSEEGKGSVFTLSLPQGQTFDNLPETAAAKSEGTFAPGSRGFIEPFIRKMAEIPVYEVSELIAVIDSIPETEATGRQVKRELKQLVYSGNSDGLAGYYEKFSAAGKNKVDLS